ncbi:MAG: hypothetical protein ACI9RU_002089 [Litorivivens sp.]|jgi:hypothetical protein
MQLKKAWATFFMVLIAMTPAMPTFGFCGFYVAKADANLFNDKSEVILVRDGNQTTITMSNDFQGEVSEFAMVVPVPVVLRKDQIRIADPSLFAKLDTYSSPRLVEYFDPMPCMPEYDYRLMESDLSISLDSFTPTSTMKASAIELGVAIEAKYDVGEYDVLILSATESTGLQTWLTRNGYKVPQQAAEVLAPYIKDQMKFFVVKVDMDQRGQFSTDRLNPIQISFESDRFMLPIRLGMANSKGTQDMIVYAFTKEGRVECANYRTVKVPTDRNIPTIIQPRFGQFYKDLFDKSYRSQGKNAIFLEYAWNVSPTWGVKCDPCNGPPPIVQEMNNAGVNWMTGNSGQVFFTRLHVRYSRDKFPQDLMFQITPNKEHFQCRYVMTHAAQGDMSCDEGQRYLKDLESRRKIEMDELIALTGWDSPLQKNYIQEYNNQIKGGLVPSLDSSSPWRGVYAFFMAMLAFALISSAWWLIKDNKVSKLK